MKYLKLFENFRDIDKLNESWFKKTTLHLTCKKYRIKNYTINGDGSIDVDGNVNLSERGLTKLPLKFNNVSHSFSCNSNNLTTLEGSPQSVGGNFWCYSNQLTTLEGGPKSVGGHFSCGNNNLTTLDGAPKSVGGNFSCGWNNLTILEGSPKSVGGDFNCGGNKILSFEGAPNHVGGSFVCVSNPIENIWKLFKDYSKVELLNDLDPIRGNDILMDRFNTFLSMIGKDEVENVDGYKLIYN